MKKKKCKGIKGHILRTEDRDKKSQMECFKSIVFSIKKMEKEM